MPNYSFNTTMILIWMTIEKKKKTSDGDTVMIYDLTFWFVTKFQFQIQSKHKI